MSAAPYRNFNINADAAVIIRLDTNFTTTITETNSLRKDEYANMLVGQIRDIVPNRDIEITEDAVITISLGLWLSKFAISIRFYDLEKNNTRPEYTQNMTDGLYAKIEKSVQQYIDDINNSKFEFITFESNELVQIYDNKIYGCFFDLTKNQYVQPPKAMKNILQIKGPCVNIRERIETFIK